MLKVKIIAMGKLTEDFCRAASVEYTKRMSRAYSLTVVEPKPEQISDSPSEGEIKKALSKETDKILAEIPPRAAVVAMCVEGKQMSSPELAEYLEGVASAGISEVVFIIGSSYGLDEQVKKRADVRLSVSKMTFPHELFRVLLLEQLYRAAEINRDSKYHK